MDSDSDSDDNIPFVRARQINRNSKIAKAKGIISNLSNLFDSLTLKYHLALRKRN
jgi:hypothetical protein